MADLHTRLGRVEIPDARDWRVEDFLRVTDTDVAKAVAELKLTTVGYINTKWKTPPVGTHWEAALRLLSSVTPPPPPPDGGMVWVNKEPVLDQGNYGTCVGNGWAQWGNTDPIDDKFVEKDARAIYFSATKHDGWPDDPDKPGGGQQGASVRGGAQAVQDMKRLNAYAFTQSIETVKTWVNTKGTAVFGTNWTQGMFNPGADGVVHPTGGVAGGHCYSCVGNLVSEGRLLFINSWSAGWGLKGYFKMSYADASALLLNGGEACMAVELP